ncbi:aspartyl/asparaginyl beta-hydroxylase domain-containing protein [Sorangium sp. So ce134]
MDTHRITTLALDAGRLQPDLARALRLRRKGACGELICGGWRSCMLWNGSGDADDARPEDRPRPAKQTAHGKALPYISDLLQRTFDLDRLRFARLARLAPGSVIVPHRDSLELREPLTRLHVPLATDGDCYSAEDDIVYRMRCGEVWFLDATRPHSAASFSGEDCVHLILDFVAVDSIDSVMRVPASRQRSIPPESVARRNPLAPGEKDALFAMASIIDRTNYKDVLAILIKKCFTADLIVSTVFDWLSAMAALSGDRELMDRVKRHEEHCLIQRQDEPRAGA